MTVDQSQIQKKYLNQIRQVCEKFRFDSLMPKITAISEASQEIDYVSIALLGGFKAGKSSFINSIIGRDVLPVGVVPLTSVITYAKYGPVEGAEVRFLDGRAQSCSLGEIADFTTEERNPQNVKRVARVNVELPGLSDYPKIHFVDTPGFGSAHQHNTLTATDWLPKVGVAFFAVTSAHPLSDRDIALITELEKHTSEIVILLTKVDLISQKERGEVADFIYKQLKQHLNKEFRLFSFSNRPGFEVLREEVLGFIRRSFAVDPSQKSQEIINHKIRIAASECREYLRVALLMAKAEQASRQKLQGLIAQEKQSLPVIRHEILLMTQDMKTRFQEKALDTFLACSAGLRKELMEDLEEQIRHWKGNLAETAEAFRNWTKVKLIKRLKAISDEKGSELAETYLHDGLTSLSRVVLAFQTRLGAAIEVALHTKFTGVAFNVQVEQPQKPNVDIGQVFMFSWGIFLYLIPMRIFRPMVNRHFLSRVFWEVEKNLYRVKAQWVDAVSASIDKMAKEAGEFINNEILTIENMLIKAPDQEKQIAEAILELDAVTEH